MDNIKEYNIYKDIKSRTKGEIYIGVVGPVRTGKSTFIKNFMDICVLPNMQEGNPKNQAKDELPQSASGKTIMTTEPKFIPKNAAKITVNDTSMDVRLIDCVGYMVEGATGYEEGESERMVKTPWFDEAIPFSKAATIGTDKVINDHSTIGIVVTCDGTFGEIPRENYIEAEERTVDELNKIGKPYIIILNSAYPYSENTLKLSKELSEKYTVGVIPLNCAQLKKEDIDNIFINLVREFPVTQINYKLPKWINLLEADNYIKLQIVDSAKNIMSNINTIRDANVMSKTIKAMVMPEGSCIENIKIDEINCTEGVVNISMSLYDNYYYETLSNLAGMEIKNEFQLIAMIRELSEKKNDYSKVSKALSDVEINGYSVVIPQKDGIKLYEPELFKNGQKYGVTIKAEATTIYMLHTQIQTEISPIVGNKQQADDLIDYINHNKENAKEGIWETNIFGKTVEQIVDDGIHEKIHNITEDNMMKIRDTLQKVMNENTGLVCLIV